MIPKVVIHAVAKEESLRDTTVEKDYVLGWMLHGIAAHASLSRWVFKGGTCLKKCFFETFRFSEDLDFTVQVGDPVGKNAIEVALKEVCDWVAAESGLQFPGDGLSVEEYTNSRATAAHSTVAPDEQRTLFKLDDADRIFREPLLSRNDPDTGLRVMASIDAHQLGITRRTQLPAPISAKTSSSTTTSIVASSSRLSASNRRMNGNATPG